MTNLSYWEHKTWFSNIDFTIVGSGIVGLSCALALRKKHPKATILILEKGILPQGASTKNAGFACFGSLSELVNDLQAHTEEEVFHLVEKRWKGLELLRKNLGDTTIDFQANKGYELFKSTADFEKYAPEMKRINRLLHSIFKMDVFTIENNIFKFQKIHNQYISNQFEGQLDTGKMMFALLKLAHKNDIKILNGIAVKSFSDIGNKVLIKTNMSEFYTNKLAVATNGFSKYLLNVNVLPARAQVLITKPIKNCTIKGTFHLDKGYYYFRNIDDRILLGGGRNLDFKAEETEQFGTTQHIQNALDDLLKEVILPNTAFEIDRRWSGIMGVGSHKKAIVKPISGNVCCGVRLGGMGVAIGSLIGNHLADIIAK